MALGAEGFTAGSVGRVRITIEAGVIYVGFMDGNASNYPSVMKYQL